MCSVREQKKSSQLTVCEAPCIICEPFVHMIVGTGLAPAVEHDKCTLTPDVSWWFSPWMCMYNGGTKKRVKRK